ncbi:MAG TPA: HhH-GPD-type base excision DNA repair protein [Acidimicrobiales bacterium]|nr:HhH-GPD-type base excision DNA repair protein [Acidimicrobiales bacterium]
MTAPSFPVTGDADKDALLVSDPFALVLGMMLDQQIIMEKAFAGPYDLRERLGGRLDPSVIASSDPAVIEGAFRTKPALHRYPAAMAKRAIALATMIVEDYSGDTASIWTGAVDGADLFARVRALPGFGDGKARIFIALLAKRFGVRPDGWADIAGDLADDTPRSVADIDSPEALERVRAWKKEQKAKAKADA